MNDSDIRFFIFVTLVFISFLLQEMEAEIEAEQSPAE